MRLEENRDNTQDIEVVNNTTTDKGKHRAYIHKGVMEGDTYEPNLT